MRLLVLMILDKLKPLQSIFWRLIKNQSARDLPKPNKTAFAGLDWHLSPTGLPLLDGAAATLSCRVWSRYPGGDHEIIVGEVYELTCSDKTPLLYGLGQLTSFPKEL